MQAAWEGMKDDWRRAMGEEGGESFDHLVGGHEQTGRRGQAKRLDRFEVEDRFVLRRRLHRKVGELGAA